MDKKIIIVGVVALLVGGGIGYMVNPHQRNHSTDKSSYHDKASTDKTTSHNTSSMGQTMDGMTSSLKGKKGDALDIAFLEGMITHHEGAVAMAKELQAGTKRPELQKMANDIISVQTTEINMMKGWLNQWFGR
jgi:uncharacterized protein (DUF305 family)